MVDSLQLTGAALHDHVLHLLQCNDLAAAHAACRRLNAEHPGYAYEAYKARSDLRTQTADRNHAAELERVLAEGISDWRGEVQIRFALAKEYEDLGDYARSWTNLAQGAQCRHQHLRYDVSVDVDTVQWITDAFPAKEAPTAGCPSTEPLFIVGMPRSGSTLVERILGS